MFNIVCIIIGLQVILYFIALSVIFRWNNKSQPVECEVLERKLYKVSGKITQNTILNNAYPLWIYKVHNPKDNSVRYLSVNGTTHLRYSKSDRIKLYTSPKGSVLFDEKVSKSTKVALFINIFGYLVAMGLCYGVETGVLWGLKYFFDLILSQDLINGLGLAYVIVILAFEVKYILLDFCFWDFKLKMRFNRTKKMNTTDVLNKAFK